METGQDLPQLHSAIGCPPTANPTGACSEGLPATLWNMSPSTAFKPGIQRRRSSGLQCRHCQSPWVEQTQLSCHHRVITTITDGARCLQNMQMEGEVSLPSSYADPNPLQTPAPPHPLSWMGLRLTLTKAFVSPAPNPPLKVRAIL